MGSLRLILAWVCDPAFGKVHLPDREQDARYWKALEPAAEKALRLRDRLRDASGVCVRFTWLVRCDGQVAALHGDPAWCLGRFSSTWSGLQAQGDSIGWIFYPAVAEGTRWTQIYADGVRSGELLSEGYEAYRAAWGAPEALLMGWHSHTQATMKRAVELGLPIDLSAIPGWYTINRGGVVPRVGACDWEITPNAPFYPSAVDHRRPIVYPNEPCQDILELPWTLGPPNWRRFQKTLVDVMRPGSLGLRRNYRRHRQGIPVRVGVGRSEFRRLVALTLDKADRGAATLTILCRMTDLSPYRSPWGADVVEANLTWLSSECRSRGLAFDSLALRDVRQKLTAGDFSRPVMPAPHSGEEAHQR